MGKTGFFEIRVNTDVFGDPNPDDSLYAAYGKVARKMVDILDGRDYLIKIDNLKDRGITYQINLYIVLADHDQARPGEVTVLPYPVPHPVPPSTLPTVLPTEGETRIKFDYLDWVAPDGAPAYRRQE